MARRDSRVYVGNLPPDIRTRDIEDLFYKFGKIVFVDLKNRKGPPFAFVEFEDPRWVVKTALLFQTMFVCGTAWIWNQRGRGVNNYYLITLEYGVTVWDPFLIGAYTDIDAGARPTRFVTNWQSPQRVAGNFWCLPHVWNLGQSVWSHFYIPPL